MRTMKSKQIGGPRQETVIQEFKGVLVALKSFKEDRADKAASLLTTGTNTLYIVDHIALRM